MDPPLMGVIAVVESAESVDNEVFASVVGTVGIPVVDTSSCVSVIRKENISANVMHAQVRLLFEKIIEKIMPHTHYF